MGRRFLNRAIPSPSYVPATARLRHAPFGMWLVQAARPKCLVELGTQDGFSYFAFCEAVLEAGLETRCIAVDTWKGDENADTSGEDVYDHARARNERYAGFSTLLRKSFSEALADVEDGSVDMLHIGGRPSYDDLRANFGGWGPKLAEDAIVLFHATEERERDPGIGRFWKEMGEAQTTHTFTIQDGLGVVFRGGDLSPEIATFRRLVADPAGHDAVVALFEAEGDALALSLRIENGATAASLESLKDRETRTGAERDQLAAKTAQLQAEALDLHNENRALRIEIAHTRRQVAKAWKERFAYNVLTGLATSRLPFDRKTRERFLRSAEKRDPDRSLSGELDPAVQRALREAPEPFEKHRFQQFPGKALRDATRRNVLVAMHETSFTGAPILAQNIMRILSERYNVYGVSIRGGDLLPHVLDHCVEVVVVGRHPETGTAAARELARFLDDKAPHFAIVNSIAARKVLPVLDNLGVTSVSLIHEFASYTRPSTAFLDMAQSSDEIVFSSVSTLENASEVAGLEAAPNVCILPQGKCVVPGAEAGDRADPLERQRLRAHLRPPGREGDFLVVGAGQVQIRKGVELFIEVARAALARACGTPLRFVWIGSGYDPKNDQAYSVYLQDQLRRAGVEGAVRFLPQTTEIDYVYELADMLLLPSRLDPLPNVAIDAMLLGKPVLCFESATGIADILHDGGLAGTCVADYLDTSVMAAKLTTLASSPELYRDTSLRTKSHAETVFNLDTYVTRLEVIALGASARKANVVEDAKIVAAEPRFDPRYVLPTGGKTAEASKAAQAYLLELSRGHARRPEPGFNPHVYCAALESSISSDPYVHFLKNGRPAGPWMLPVIGVDAASDPSDLRCALHVHASEPDALGSVLSHLAANRSRPDLFVTVTDDTARATAERALSGYEGRVSLHVVPSVGRDIGPFLTGIGDLLVRDYDIVGHMHTEECFASSNDSQARTSTRFLLENVLGGPEAGATMDRVLTAFAADEGLGVVFPSDPHVSNWSRNRSIAESLTARMDVGPLPTYFDFPTGTMFWMRTEALQPFVDLRLALQDYPNEPLGHDGTILHALERLFGIVPVLQGFGAAVTATPGVTR